MAVPLEPAVDDIVFTRRPDRRLSDPLFLNRLTGKYDIPTVASLNTLMVDGTGMCGGCRVEVVWETKFACVDGPDFDGHQVDFDDLMSRLGRFSEEERAAMKKWSETCRMAKQPPVMDKPLADTD